MWHNSTIYPALHLLLVLDVIQNQCSPCHSASKIEALWHLLVCIRDRRTLSTNLHLIISTQFDAALSLPVIFSTSFVSRAIAQEATRDFSMGLWMRMGWHIWNDARSFCFGHVLGRTNQLVLIILDPVDAFWLFDIKNGKAYVGVAQPRSLSDSTSEKCNFLDHALWKTQEIDFVRITLLMQKF